MKKLAFTLVLATSILLAACTQRQDSGMEDMKDKMAIKELVDTFSILADQKDTDAQALLFTEDAIVDSYRGDQLISSLKGREEIGNGFGAYLALFETVYHINGQQTVSFDGNKATGVSYCQVVLIREQDGKRMMSTDGVYYNDEYVKVDGRWLIAKRTSHFVWNDQKEISKSIIEE